MLGKLLKYEFKATSKFFISMYLLIVVTIILNGVFMLNSIMSKSQHISIMVIASLLIALITLTVIICINRFRKNLLGEEGYLMFTIPTKTYKIILSKYICSLIWTLLTFIITIISYSIIMVQQSTSIGTIYGEGVTLYIDDKIISFTELAKTNKDFIVIAFVILLILSFISIVIFAVYNSLAIAQLSIFNKYRTIASTVSFLGICVVLNGLNILANNIFPKPDISDLTFIGAFTKVMTLGILENFIIIIILFIGLNYTLTKKLNLD